MFTVRGTMMTETMKAVLRELVKLDGLTTRELERRTGADEVMLNSLYRAGYVNFSGLTDAYTITKAGREVVA